uniref:large ribosomal subunit protein bL36m n=1 Tax=Pristiophorus japonicus TaxID=55135 RepID=UPI00398EAB9E
MRKKQKDSEDVKVINMANPRQSSGHWENVTGANRMAIFVKNLFQVVNRPLLQLNRCSVLYWPSICSVTYKQLSIAVTVRPKICPDPYKTIRLAAMSFLEPNRLQGVQEIAGMKTKTALKKRCKDCFFVRRRGHLYVYCKTHPRHKQRQG